MFALVKSIAALAVARFLQGLSSGVVWTLALALVADAYHGDFQGLGGAMGIVLVGYTLGQLSGPPIGGFLYSISFYAPFILCGCIIMLDFIGRALVIEPVIEEPETAESGVSRQPGPMIQDTAGPSNQTGKDETMEVIEMKTADVEAATITNDVEAQGTSSPPTKVNVTFLSVLRNKPLLILCTLIMASSILITGLEPTVPLFLSSTYNLTTSQIGLVFITLIVPTLIMSPIAGLLYDKLGHRPVLLTGIIASVIVTPTVAIQVSLVWNCIAFFLVSCFMTVALAPILPEIANVVPREAYARYLF
ncbi:hypothetical protein HDU76_000558 [Blyttiomyces sp. JEL0837]|nr:hypothetical protein HDU76_000558 [Blyttiomyces sp. JEL0837]